MLAVNAALALERPLLIKGEPGTGKTLLAFEEVARALGNARCFQWHIKSTTKAQQGLYEYDAVSRLRDSQLGDAQGCGNRATTSSPACCGRPSKVRDPGRRPYRRNRQGRHRVSQRPAARTRPDGVPRLRNASDRFTATASSRLSSSRPTTRRNCPTPSCAAASSITFAFRIAIRWSRIVDVHYPGLKKSLLTGGPGSVLQSARSARPQEKAVHIGVARLAQGPAGRGYFAGGTAQHRTRKLLIPPLHGALLKNEQDVHLFERVAFMARAGR